MIAEQGQVTDRFSRAVEQLGNSSIEVRLGAIYALERLAADSPVIIGQLSKCSLRTCGIKRVFQGVAIAAHQFQHLGP